MNDYFILNILISKQFTIAPLNTQLTSIRHQKNTRHHYSAKLN